MGRTRRKRRRKTPAVDYDEDVINLLKWLRLKDKNLKIRSFPATGRGIQSKRTIHAGENLISLPLQALITPKFHNYAVNLVNEISVPPQLLLTVFLIYEYHLGDDSQYRCYIKLLPTSYTTLFFCDEDEIDVLPGVMKEAVLRQKHELNQYFNVVDSLCSLKVCPHCGVDLMRIFDFGLFTWGWFTVNTRCVFYKDGDYDSLALAPFLDMFNHSVDAGTEMIIDKKENLYILKTLKEVRKKEQVFISYGGHNNWKLLLEYGFVLENNHHDFVEFEFEDILVVLKNCHCEYGNLDKVKYKFIKQNDLDVDLKKYRDGFSWNMNSLMYVLVVDNKELANVYNEEADGPIQDEMGRVADMLIKQKREELMNELNRMEAIGEGSQPFAFAKDLIRMYIGIL